MIAVIGPEELASANRSLLDRLLSGRALTVAMGEGIVAGEAAAALFHSDVALLADGSRLVLDTARAWSGVVWRLGRSSLRLHLQSVEALDARTARALGLCDEVVPAGMNPLQWVSDWMGSRSALALQSAAFLLRKRGGDALERAEFAGLFATGQPQRGLEAFLTRRRTDAKG